MDECEKLKMENGGLRRSLAEKEDELRMTARRGKGGSLTRDVCVVQKSKHHPDCNRCFAQIQDQYKTPSKVTKITLQSMMTY